MILIHFIRYFFLTHEQFTYSTSQNIKLGIIETPNGDYVCDDDGDAAITMTIAEITAATAAARTTTAVKTTSTIARWL
jgi:hypothetical protein